MSYTVTLVIHVDDYHARPEPKVVATIEEVKDLLSQVHTTWAQPGTVVTVQQVGDLFKVRVEN